MRKLLLRVALFAVAIPLIYVLLFRLTYIRHLALHVAIILVTLAGAIEIRIMLDRTDIPPFPVLAPILSASLPLAVYLEGMGFTSSGFAAIWQFVAFSTIMVWGVLITRGKDFPRYLTRTVSSLFVILYPGFFLSFGSRLVLWENPAYKFLFFLSLVFCNDTLAYVFGKLFGRPLNIPISPAKSLVGFAAGILGSIGISVLFFRVVPGFSDYSLTGMILLSVVVGGTAIIGDLIESAVKRSADVKDSGVVMMGRGGMMDSIDSLIFAAPVFYFLFPLLG